MLFGDEKKSHQVVEKEMPRTDLQELCLRRCVGEVPRRVRNLQTIKEISYYGLTRN
jgi:hypothetical protein